MTDRAEIERLLNQTGRTLDSLPEKHGFDELNRARTMTAFTPWSETICHQSDVIELLVGALQDALAKVPRWISVKEEMTISGTGHKPNGYEVLLI